MQKVIFLVITVLSSMQVAAMDVVAVPKKKFSKKEKYEQFARALYQGESADAIRELPVFDPNCFLNLKYLVKPISIEDQKKWGARGKSLTDFDLRLSFFVYFLIGYRKRITPLQLAIWQEHAHLVKFLLDQGAQVNHTSTNAYTKMRSVWNKKGHYKNHPLTKSFCIVRPLDIALLIGKAEIAQMLLDHGVVSAFHPAIAALIWPEFVNYCNARGLTPFKKEFQKSVMHDSSNQIFQTSLEG